MRTVVAWIDRQSSLAMLDCKLGIVGSKRGRGEPGPRIGILRLERRQIAQSRDSRLDLAQFQK
jgi:hypothetical protein